MGNVGIAVDASQIKLRFFPQAGRRRDMFGPVIGTNVKELKVPPNNPVGQRAYDAVAKAAEGEIVSFTFRIVGAFSRALT